MNSLVDRALTSARSVVIAISVTASIMCYPAFAQAAGLNVDSHSREDVVEYLENNGAMLSDEVTYESKPSLEQPYSAGVLSDETIANSIKMLNNVRYIAGLQQVSSNSSKAAGQQASALVNALNGGLSHSPTQPAGLDDETYQAGRSAAGQANLAYGLKNLNTTIVHGWMDDSDSSNIKAVGHRRWCLNPKMGTTAFGAVSSYYSMYAFDKTNSGASQTNVAWPAQQMPLEYFGDSYAWSLSTGTSVTASDVNVTLTRRADGETWTFASSGCSNGEFYVDNVAYGQTGCVIFKPNDITYADGDVFDVAITGVGSDTISYSVEFFRLEDYWHQHSFTKSFRLNANKTEAIETISCTCGIEKVFTHAVTSEFSPEPTCTDNGWMKYSYVGSDGFLRSQSSYLPAYGHEMKSDYSLVDNVATGSCVRCGTEMETGVVTAFSLMYNDGTSSSASSALRNLNICNVGGTMGVYCVASAGGNSEVTTYDKNFTFVSSNENVVHVEKRSNTFGLLTAVGPGVATITMYPTLNPSLTKTVTMYVGALEKATVSVGSGGSYTGTEITPSVTVTYSDEDLVPGIDYLVAYSNNVNAGVATVTVTGIGNYAGTVRKTFTVTRAQLIATYASENVTCTKRPSGFVNVTGFVNDETVDTAADFEMPTVDLSGKGIGKHTITPSGGKANNYEFEYRSGTLTISHGEIVDDSAIDPTCTEDGRTKGSHCAECDEVLVAQEEIPALGHDVITDPAIAAACTEPGKTKGSHCGRCDEVLVAQETVPATGHSAGEAVEENRVEATCTAAGSYEEAFYCTICGEMTRRLINEIPALGHDIENDPAVAATCTESGLTEGSHCGRCDEVLAAQEVVAALGHDVIADPAVAATCTEPGKTEGSHCNRCGTAVVGQEEVPALGHKVVTDSAVAATCTESGLTEGSHCGRCDEVLVAQETVPALGHDIVTDSAVAATCTESGLTEGSHCGRCDEVLVAQETVPATGHSAGEAVEENRVEATCTAAGSYEEATYCKACGVETSRASKEAVALGHDVVTDSAKEATCTESGLTEGSHCGRCDEVLEAQKAVPALGHDVMTDPAVAATCTEPGKTEGSHCDRCGTAIVGQEEVPALGHKVVTDPAKEATCTESGLTEGSHCSRCGEVLTAQEAVPATGHSWSAWAVTKEAADGAAGERARSCGACGATETQEIPSAASSEKEANAEAVAQGFVGTEKTVGKRIIASKGDEGPKGTAFSLLQAKAAKVTKSSVKVTWKRVPGAKRYLVYGNQCGKGKRYRLMAATSKASYAKKSLRKGTYHKFLVMAVDSKGRVISVSKTVHAATSGGKVGNDKKVTTAAKRGKAILKKGKTLKLKAKAVPAGKKLKVKRHRKVAYETSDAKVAIVTKSGVVKGKGKGTCYVYAYAQNGVCAKVKVTVK